MPAAAAASSQKNWATDKFRGFFIPVQSWTHLRSSCCLFEADVCMKVNANRRAGSLLLYADPLWAKGASNSTHSCNVCIRATEDLVARMQKEPPAVVPFKFLQDALDRILNSDIVFAMCTREVPWDHPMILVGFVKTKYTRVHGFEIFTLLGFPHQFFEMLISNTSPVHSSRCSFRNERAEFAHEPNGSRCRRLW